MADVQFLQIQQRGQIQQIAPFLQWQKVVVLSVGLQSLSATDCMQFWVLEVLEATSQPEQVRQVLPKDVLLFLPDTHNCELEFFCESWFHAGNMQCSTS